MAAEPRRVVQDAPAKINLALHVTGRRADGYHLIDSLVVFAALGDRIAAEPARDWSLTVTGPFAQGLEGPKNLCLRAARLTGGAPAALTLDKRLPVASGIGGGSADAAATLRALHALDGRALPDPLPLGADVPVCLHGRPARMQGIGERLSSLPPLPPLHLCLANPGVPVSTPDTFRALTSPDNAPLPPLPEMPDAAAVGRWLATARNDLEPPARALHPAIGTVLAALADTDGCLVARMSGSGATCFGLYATAAEAGSAAAALSGGHPGWWVASAPVLG